MRLSTQQLHDRNVNLMLEQHGRLVKTQQQLATGRRFESASEDPTAAVAAMRLKRELAAIDRYQANAEVVRARQSAEETVLASVTDLLHNARELMIQGNNGTLDDADRQALSLALDQRLEELLGLANTRHSDGEYLFAGFQSRTRPFAPDGRGAFTYRGDEGQREVEIGPGVRATASDSGDEVFQRVQIEPAGYRDIFSILHSAARVLEGPTDTPDAQAALHRALSGGLTELESALEHILTQRARIGARLNLIDNQTDANEAFRLTATEALSEAQDLDYAEAAVRLQTAMIGLEAAQRSYLQIRDLSLFRLLG